MTKKKNAPTVISLKRGTSFMPDVTATCTCDDVDLDLAALTEGTLSDAGKRRLAHHLSWCEDCREMAVALLGAVEAARFPLVWGTGQDAAISATAATVDIEAIKAALEAIKADVDATQAPVKIDVVDPVPSRWCNDTSTFACADVRQLVLCDAAAQVSKLYARLESSHLVFIEFEAREFSAAPAGAYWMDASITGGPMHHAITCESGPPLSGIIRPRRRTGGTDV